MIQPNDLLTLRDIMGFRLVEEVTGSEEVTQEDIIRLANREGYTECLFGNDVGMSLVKNIMPTRCRIFTDDGIIWLITRG